MKIIISHDVDHITAWEHSKDLILLKSVVRGSVELAIGKIGVAEYILKFRDIVINKYQNLDELMSFDRENGVDSTFFIGVNHGLGLCYSLENAEYWAKRILNNNFDVGVHGIEFEELESIKKEFEIFKNISGIDNFGIRMHYLRKNYNTLNYLENVGYQFDSTCFELKDVSKIGKMWEFPLHLMDTSLFNKNSRWQNRTLEQAKDRTKKIIEEADKKGIKYLTILFHDRYFSKSFKSWKNWYIWVVGYLKTLGVEFTTYREAIKELEK